MHDDAQQLLRDLEAAGVQVCLSDEGRLRTRGDATAYADRLRTWAGHIALCWRRAARERGEPVIYICDVERIMARYPRRR
jgi:hypothetical protein